MFAIKTIYILRVIFFLTIGLFFYDFYTKVYFPFLLYWVAGGALIIGFGAIFDLNLRNELQRAVRVIDKTFMNVFRWSVTSNSFGIVYDSITEKAVTAAIVRVYTKDGKLSHTDVTDHFGVFSVPLKPGKYRFEVAKRGYVFPTSIVICEKDYYPNLYLGGIYKKLEDEEISLSIPLDPVNASFKRVVFLRFAEWTRHIIEMFTFIFFALLPDFFVNLLVVEQTVLTFFCFYMYLYVLGKLIYLTAKRAPSFGVVEDRLGNPIEGVEMIIRELDFNRVVAERLTDAYGRYRLAVTPGLYEVTLLNRNFITKVLTLNTKIGSKSSRFPEVIDERFVLLNK